MGYPRSMMRKVRMTFYGQSIDANVYPFHGDGENWYAHEVGEGEAWKVSVEKDAVTGTTLMAEGLDRLVAIQIAEDMAKVSLSSRTATRLPDFAAVLRRRVSRWI